MLIKFICVLFSWRSWGRNFCLDDVLWFWDKKQIINYVSVYWEKRKVKRCKDLLLLYMARMLGKFSKVCFTCNIIYIVLKLRLVFKTVFIIFMFFLGLANKALKNSSVMWYLKSRFTCFFRCSSIFRITDGSKLF